MMKKNFTPICILSFGMLLTITACNSPKSGSENTVETIDSANMPVITFEKKSFDFGTINQGDTVKYAFTFTNEGKTPLTILEATPSCGCTTPSFTKTPIAPGEKGSIDVVFNSTNFNGKVMKAVQVISNAKENPTIIYLEGNINPKK